jgi:NAD(P)-dependent dehydrogenase (short-subunit alcohol dehydrogenase family)
VSSTVDRTRTAVITGAAQGHGAAMASRLAADGFHVVAVDLRVADETVDAIHQAGGQADAVVCDVADEESVGHLRDEVVQRFGGADVLVNNAMINIIGPIDELELADWHRVIGVGLTALFLTCRAFAPGMRERGWGRIVNLSSNTVGLVVPAMVPYVTAKLGTVGFTRALATDLGPHGITVNTLAPGLTRTPSVAAVMPDHVFDAGADLPAVKRLQVVEDLVGALSFLVSDDAAFFTAQTMFVDGGYVRG